MNKSSSKLGIGTLSVPLALFGLLFGFKIGEFCLGDAILKFLRIPSWSKGSTGIHYTVFYSLVFFAVAFLLSAVWGKDYGARFGRMIAMILAGSILIFVLFCTFL